MYFCFRTEIMVHRQMQFLHLKGFCFGYANANVSDPLYFGGLGKLLIEVIYIVAMEQEIIISAFIIFAYQLDMVSRVFRKALNESYNIFFGILDLGNILAWMADTAGQM